VTRWGVQVGDLVVEIAGEGPAGIVPQFEPTAPPTLLLHARATEEPLWPDDSRVVLERPAWAVLAGERSLSFILRGEPGPVLVRIDLGMPFSPEGQLRFRPEIEHNPLIWKPLDELLFQYLLSTRGGLLFHAGALAAHGGGVMFAGISGAGKTTMGRACHAAGAGTVLSDERAVVRPTAAGWVVDGTPWAGEGRFRARVTAPLRAVVLLDKASEDRLEPVSPGRALAYFYRCHLPPMWSAEATTTALDSLERLVREVPCLRLCNRLGGDGPALLNRYLAAHA
jgi:hypothetical protein